MDNARSGLREERASPLMNAKTARQILLCRRPTGEDDSDPSVKRALDVAAKDPSLAAELEKQTVFDLGLCGGY